MSEWKIPKGRRACAGCQREFQPEEPILSVLRDEVVEGRPALVRDDRCSACEPGAPRDGALSHWRTAAPRPDAPKRPRIDEEAVAELFRNLASDPDPARRPLRYVLALILTRRKVLRFTGGEGEGEARVLLLEERATGEVHKIPDLPLSEADIDRVTDEIRGLFQGEV